MTQNLENTEYKAQILSHSEFRKFISSRHDLVLVDAFSRQIKELFFIDNHEYIGLEKEAVYNTLDFETYRNSKKNEHVYVYYPWNKHVVRCVNSYDYFRLKTNRNRDLITPKEQKILSDYRVAVFGMSVGSNIAIILTQSGISNKIIIADFDDLDTSNLNRILAGVHQIGLNKTIVTARKIYEDNPFADVLPFSEGINEDSLEELLINKKIDCIVEEVDDISFKIRSRILAIKYKIPVMMITDNGDGVVLHVERYDLGHNKIWGKEPSYFEKKIMEGPIAKEKAGQIIMFDIVGGPDRVDPRMMSSVKMVLAKELVSWSQLGSAAILGGVVLTYIIKKIVFGENSDLDIRAYISPEGVVYKNHQS